MKRRTATHILPCARRQPAGTALVAILLTVLMLAVVVMTSLSGAAASVALSRGVLARAQSLYTAESGTNFALWQLSYGEDAWSGWTLLPGGEREKAGTVTNGDGNAVGTFTVTVSDPLADDVEIASTGRRVTGYDTTLITRQMAASVHRPPAGEGWFQWGGFAGNNIRINNQAVVDSYNSDLGSYEQTQGAEAAFAVCTVGSQKLRLRNQAQLKGNAYCHPDDQVSAAIRTRHDSVITGARQTLEEAYEQPAMLPPEGITNVVNNWYVNGEETLTEDISCRRLVVRQGGKLTIDGDVTIHVRTRPFRVRDGSELQITEGSTLTVYAGKNVQFSHTAKVNTDSKDPETLVIYGLSGCTSITLNDAAVAYAAVYAPNAAFRGTEDSEFFGAVVANKIRLRNNHQFHQDRGLNGSRPDGLPEGGGEGNDAGSWTVNYWRITR